MKFRIPKQHKPTRERVDFKLERSLIEQLDRYCQYTDTAWWQDEVMRAQEIRFLRGRVTFVGARSPAPFPSAVVIFKKPAASALPRVIAWHLKSSPRCSTRRTGDGSWLRTPKSPDRVAFREGLRPKDLVRCRNCRRARTPCS